MPRIGKADQYIYILSEVVSKLQQLYYRHGNWHHRHEVKKSQLQGCLILVSAESKCRSCNYKVLHFHFHNLGPFHFVLLVTVFYFWYFTRRK